MPVAARSRGIGPQGTTGNAVVPEDPFSKLFSIYGSASQQQLEDYGNIMSNYRKLYEQGPTSEFRNAVKNSRQLAETGGYSQGDIANLRERGVSPIRSIYAGAKRDIDRQKAIQGGYSPNYAAVRAKSAREMSDVIGDKITKINADIAQNVASNRIAAQPGYASAAGKEMDYPVELLRSMTSLFGTSPGMASTFGSQALQASDLASRNNQQSQNNLMDILRSIIGRV